MQLKKLKLSNHYILKDMEIDFSKPISVIIGENGSGKSTLLRVIAEIFSEAFLDKYKVDYDYSLHYTIDVNKNSKVNVVLSNNNINVDYDGIILKSRESIKQSKKINPSGITSINDAVKKILPSSIVIYYAGFDTKMKEMCQPHLQNQIEAFKKGNSSFQRAIIYCDDFDFKILTALYLSEAQNDEIKEIISNFDSEQQITQYLVLDDKKKPSKGLGQFIDLIVSESEGIATKIRIKPKLGLLAKDSKTIFENLDIAYKEGILKDIETGNYKDNQLSSENVFSEGQQQLLIIKALNKIFDGENCLFLFDEPDTFLHPKWQAKFIEDIAAASKDKTSNFIITTHSPLILANAQPNVCDVKIMEQGKFIANSSGYFGQEINDILYSFMDTPKRNPRIEQNIDELFRLIALEKIEESEVKYQELVSIIGEGAADMTRALIEINFLKSEADEINN
jgi:predicted ATP-binding protein involved in virulence